MTRRDDTIAAVATPAGAGGVGVIRVSGPLASTIGQQLSGKKLQPRRVRFSTLRDADATTLDRGLCVYFKAPASFTGEDVLELHAHGSPVVLDLLLKRIYALGAQPARPGEFSERAFLNGKLDLVQAEAVADLIASGSEAAARAALRSLDGAFSQQVNEVLDALVRLRVRLEGALDFPEEEIDFLSEPQLKNDLAALQARTTQLLGATRSGVVLRDGLHVVIVGRPNVGKSSLLNALAQSERAIVTAIPGTTRDLLRESVQLDGIGLTLVDTAGLRASEDEIEREGIRRAQAELQRADVAILVTESSHVDGDAMLLDACSVGATRLVVHNKIDLTGEAAHVQRAERAVHIYLSAQRGDGLADLRSELSRLAMPGDATQGTFSARTRHVLALEIVVQHLDAAVGQLESGAGELVAEELRHAQRSLGEITGVHSNEDLLGAIFSTFCIGK
ncbi:MAG: tRNA uridine-5-carboxymethylaminomethyl(34) synthesis GTPase MnmE [Rudaea sp.]